MSVLGLILARGGSKRVPMKNLRPLGGKPLIVWTIEAARKSLELSRIIVSTDNNEIRSVSMAAGADVIMRPAALATDEMSSYPPIIHALGSIDEQYAWLCLLQPTSPFREARDIDECVMRAQVAASFSRMPACVSVEHGKSVPNGATYVARTKWLRRRLAEGDTHPFDAPEIDRYYMTKQRSLDIDTEEDFAAAEAFVNKAAA